MNSRSVPMNTRTGNGTNNHPHPGRLLGMIGCVLTPLLLLGCASYGEIQNTGLTGDTTAKAYSISDFREARDDDNLSLILAFSGGGTRAAALAYGVMLELRDTQVFINGRPRRMLDEIDVISSVSGGSFTSAYYGLYGEGLFDGFEEKFLRYDLDKHLVYRLMNPVQWFSHTGRTEMAIKYYRKLLFQDATFADMMKPGRPLVVINTSDLAWGVRFSFVQEYFDLLCSDLASFPVARAVAASSAVPVVFNPVVVENYPGCSYNDSPLLHEDQQRFKDEPELEMTTYGLESYADKEQRKYIHFVDGGITDNTGLRAIYDVLEVAGGPAAFLTLTGRPAPRQLAVIAVNASTHSVPDMGLSNKAPSMAESMDAVTDVQLHRYNVSTEELLEQSMKSWTEELSTDERAVTPYFVQVSFGNIKTSRVKYFLNKIPTSFSLTDEQVDTLISSGRELLRTNPVFQQLLEDLASAP